MKDPKDYYSEQGYYIFRNLIPHDFIDEILHEYQAKILNSDAYFFRQSIHRWQKNRLTEYGYSEESFRDIHDYVNYPSFSYLAKKILCFQGVRQALSQLTCSETHSLMQSMMFDMNAATPAHQDWYYLDSIPSGHLLGGWFALEDIQEEAGRFYVFPGSHKIDFDLTADQKIANSPYVKRINLYLEENADLLYAPALHKGDVLFWNSGLVHGSLPTLAPQYSRKSLTGHYLPGEYAFGNRYEGIPRSVEYMDFEGMNCKVIRDEYKRFSVRGKLKLDFINYLEYNPTLKRLYKATKSLIKATNGVV